MLGGSFVPSQAPAPSQQGGAKPGFQQTMLGGSFMPQPGAPGAPGSPAAGAPASTAPVPGGAVSAKHTMLGVAMPGIAPAHSSVPQPPGAGAPPGPQAAPMGAGPSSMGPGPVQAPQRRSAPLQATVALVAAPAPLEDVTPPPPPKIVKAKGVPLVLVASVMGGLVVIAGVAGVILLRKPPPISAQPKAAPDGKDILHLTCDPASCKDGTTATLGGANAAKTTFAGGQAELTLAEPLHVGDNDLALQIDRPGVGRDEEVKLVVPVAFRVHADISTMASLPPTITVRAEALPGSTVVIDGKSIALDARGTGSYAVDETAATEGPADESKAIAADIPYVVTPKGGTAQNGTVSARVAVSPLRVDAPGVRGVSEDDHFVIAGRAAKGANIVVDGAPVAVSADGSFESTVAMPGPGDKLIVVRGGTSALTPRTVHVALRRVPSLAGEAKNFEAQKLISYGDAIADPAKAAGQQIALEGEVFESRASGHRTIILLANRRGCATGACIVKVVIGREMKLTRNDVWRAYGTVTGGSPNAAGQTTLEIDADFMVPGRSKK
jgi:hypothetical protein